METPESLLDEPMEGEPLPPEEPAESTEPKMVRIKFNGNFYDVPEHMADVWFQREELYDKKIREMGTENARLRNQPKPEPPPSRSEPDPNEDLEYFTSPSQAVNKRIQAVEERLVARLHSEYQVEQERQRFWTAFRSEYPDLAGQDRLVGYIVNEGYNDLKDLSPEACRQEIAARAYELRGTPPAKPTKTLTDRQTPSERAHRGPAPSPPVQPPQPSPPIGLSGRLRALQEEKRRAQYNVKE